MINQINSLVTNSSALLNASNASNARIQSNLTQTGNNQADIYIKSTPETSVVNTQYNAQSKLNGASSLSNQTQIVGYMPNIPNAGMNLNLIKLLGSTTYIGQYLIQINDDIGGMNWVGQLASSGVNVTEGVAVNSGNNAQSPQNALSGTINTNNLNQASNLANGINITENVQNAQLSSSLSAVAQTNSNSGNITQAVQSAILSQANGGNSDIMKLFQ